MGKAKDIHRCFYCGEARSMSKEHLIADWVKSVVPRVEASHTHTGLHLWQGEPGKLYVRPKKAKTNQGNLGTKQLRRVCVQCNNGWMKEIQDEVKPILSPYLEGVWDYFDIIVARRIALWATMTVMNIDAAHFDDSGVPKDELRYLCKNRQPPPNWQIWMGRRTGGYSIETFHRPLGMYPTGSPLPTNPARNGQITTVCVGRVVLHAVSLPPPGSINDVLGYGAILGLMPIYPLWGGDVMDWRHAPLLTPADVTRVADSLTYALVAQNVSHLPTSPPF